jgi:hypothetical protein
VPDSAAQDQVEAAFFTNGLVNSFPGSQDVPYPTTAPGWATDPSGTDAALLWLSAARCLFHSPSPARPCPMH